MLQARLGYLEPLLVPQGPTSFDRSRHPAGCTYDRRWNLMVPLKLVRTAEHTDFYRWPPRIPEIRDP